MRAKKVCATCLKVVFAVVLVFCSVYSAGAANLDPGSLKFVFLAPDLANTWVAALKDGFEAGCKELGIGNYVSLNAASDLNRQVADLENSIGGGYNAVVFCPMDAAAEESLIDEATSKGIATVAVAQVAKNTTAGIELDEKAYGILIATNLVNWVKANISETGKGASVLLLAEDSLPTSIARGDAIEKTVKDNLPEAVWAGRQNAHVPELGLKVTESVLLSHPELNVVVSCNDSGALGGYEAMKNAGHNGKKNYGVFGGDATEPALAAMKEEGSIYRATADLYPYESGVKAVKMAYEYLKNGLPKEHVVEPLGMMPVTQEDVLTGKYPPQ
ncbi:MAG: sugar ABC transporter substrate-binding protein [Synergistaceae bacterium]|jgi:ABC-type sugar transport system substrate-binding protein|nr:sugar ABC transporter substrate-binding protein [Synergistaceae bacterium]